MKFKTFNEKQLKFVNEGAFGAYYQIKNTNYGIKVIVGDYDLGFTSMSELKSTDIYKDAVKEYRHLYKLYKKSKSVPRPICMALMSFEREHYSESYWNGCQYVDEGKYTVTSYLPAFMMQHIEGKTVSKSHMSEKNHYKLQKARISMREKGIYFSDGHGGNVIKVKGKESKFIFVDPFSMSFDRRDDVDCNFTDYYS